MAHSLSGHGLGARPPFDPACATKSHSAPVDHFNYRHDSDELINLRRAKGTVGGILVLNKMVQGTKNFGSPDHLFRGVVKRKGVVH